MKNPFLETYKNTYYQTKIKPILYQKESHEYLSVFQKEIDKLHINALFQEKYNDVFCVEFSILKSCFFKNKAAGLMEVYTYDWYLNDPILTSNFQFSTFETIWYSCYQEAQEEAKNYLQKIQPYEIDQLFSTEINFFINKIVDQFFKLKDIISQKIKPDNHSILITFGKIRDMQSYFYL